MNYSFYDRWKLGLDEYEQDQPDCSYCGDSEIGCVHCCPLTIDEVKEKLPNVKIRNEYGFIIKANLGGRENKYASVWWNVGNCEVSYEFSWESVTEAINKDQPLIIS